MTPRERKKLIKELDAINVKQNTMARQIAKKSAGTTVDAADFDKMIRRRNEILKELNPHNG
jgi:hypothetical protein